MQAKKLTEERRREILALLEKERGERKRRAAENTQHQYPRTERDKNSSGMQEEYRTSLRDRAYEESPAEMTLNLKVEEFKDPNDIMVSTSENEEIRSLSTIKKEDTGPDPSCSFKNNMNKKPVFDQQLMKECLDYSGQAINTIQLSPSNQLKEMSSLSSEDRVKEQKASPQSKPPIYRNNKFTSDQRYRVAQEIQRKYNNSKIPSSSPSGFRRPTVSQESSRLEAGLRPAHAPCRSARKEPYSSNPPGYLKPTSAAGLKSAKNLRELPAQVRKIAEERELKKREECTFQPHISASQFSSKLELNRAERWKRLLETKTSQIQRREKLKQQKDAEDCARFCTFQPQCSEANLSCRMQEYLKCIQ